MIGAPPAREDEPTRISGARDDFVSSLPRRLEVLRLALRALEEQPREASRRNGLLRRLHALGSAARVLGFASVAEALSEAEKTLHRAEGGGPAARDLIDVGRALALLPSLVGGGGLKEPAEAGSTPGRAEVVSGLEFPVSVLVFGSEALASTLAGDEELRIECRVTAEPAKAIEIARLFAPEVVVIDAEGAGASELIDLLTRDPEFDPPPVVLVGESVGATQSATLSRLGASRVLEKPVSPDALRRTVFELRDGGTRAATAREPFGDLNITELCDRVAAEVRRGLVDATDPGLRARHVSFEDGADVLGAVWGAVARLRELVTLRSEGDVRFDDTGPEGAVPFAPWAERRRAGERGGGARRAASEVSLQGRRVVVADDDPAVVWFLAGLLKTVGAEVFEAHDGERAIELTRELWPDLVVSDVLMPKLDGFSLCHEIKRDVVVRDTPVILLSWKEDLLQRVHELGGAADGYLRKEAAASTVVERLREVLRPRARVEQRLLAGGEVRGRLEGLTPRLILELSCRLHRDLRLTFRDAAYSYEVQVRSGAPRRALRSAPDGGIERGEAVLAMLLGVSAGRFAVEPDSSAFRPELAGDLAEQLAGPVARARAAQRALSAAALLNVTRVVFDVARVEAYLHCTPEPARGLLRQLVNGSSPRQLLANGQASVQVLEAALSDFARRGAILQVEGANGVEDILRTAVPPPVALSEAPGPLAAEGSAPFESEPLPPTDSHSAPHGRESQSASADEARAQAPGEGPIDGEQDAAHGAVGAAQAESTEDAPSGAAGEASEEATGVLTESTEDAPSGAAGEAQVERTGVRAESTGVPAESTGDAPGGAAGEASEESTAELAKTAADATGDARAETASASKDLEEAKAEGESEAELVAGATFPEDAALGEGEALAQPSSPAVDTQKEAPEHGWFSFQLDASPTAPPTEHVADPLPPVSEVTPSFAEIFHPSPAAAAEADDAVPAPVKTAPPPDPYAGTSPERTLSSSAPPPAIDSARPGASVPVVGRLRNDALDRTLESEPNLREQLAASLPGGDADSPEARDSSDPLTAVLTSDTPAPPPVESAPSGRAAKDNAPELAASSLAVSPKIASPQAHGDSPRKPDSRAAKGEVSEPRKAKPVGARATPAAKPGRPAPRTGPVVETPVEEAGGTLKTLLFAALAAVAAYAAVATARAWLSPPPPPVDAGAAATNVAPLPATKPSEALELREELLGAQSGVDSGSGLLELEIPAGTVVRVDGQTFGVAPTRPLTLAPGPHQLQLGDREPARLLIKAGTRTLARLPTVAKATSSAGSP